MDTYQAVYDAARSRIGSVDTRDAIERAAREAFDMGNARALLIEQICMVGNEMSRPSAVYRPALLQDGTEWCALFGENLQEGVAGFGDTPDEAMRAFDQAWLTQKTPAAIRAELPEQKLNAMALKYTAGTQDRVGWMGKEFDR